MPVSRQRKISRAKKRPRSLSAQQGNQPSSRKSIDIRVVIIVLILAVAGSTVAYVVANRGGQAGNEVTTNSGLKYVDLKVGNGATPQKGQTVTVHYIGTLQNGQEFENSYTRGTPATFRVGVGELIKGWDEGLMTMKVGGKRRLICPPDLAYGQPGRPPNIPPNSTLTFEIELLDVKNSL